MYGLSLLVWLTFAQMPAVQASTLAGEQYQGTLEAFTAESVVVKTESKSVCIPIAEILVLRSTAQAIAPSNDSPIEIRLVDMTRLRVKAFTSTGTVATIVHTRLGEFKIPTASISSVRLAPLDAKVDTEWSQLLDRTLKKDVIAVRKGDVLDHLDGIIGSLNDLKMQFQMDGDDIEVKREKVFGLIFSKRESSVKKAVAQLDLVSGDRLSLKQISWNGSMWKVRLASGLELEIAPDLFQTLDYSLGKVTFLSDIEPRSAKYLSYWGPTDSLFIYEYRRDKNFDGSRISLGEKSYAKGLAIHSQSQLMYRLGGDYRRFQAVMGIGDEVPSGDVNVVLKGDNKILFKGAVKASETSEKGAIRRAPP